MRKEGGLEKITVVTQGQGGEAYIETSHGKEEKIQETSKEDTPTLISSLPVLDAQRIMELRGVVNLEEVLVSFENHGQNLISGLKTLIEEENYVRAAKQAHALKGACSNDLACDKHFVGKHRFTNSEKYMTFISRIGTSV